jgi:outer membrane lipoprotein-sorting protein
MKIAGLKYVLFFFLVFSLGWKSAEPTAREIMDKMLVTIPNVKALKYHLKNSERIKGEMHHTESVVKLQAHPRKIYLYLKGPELLWIEGENNGHAFVNPSSFPYINLNLNPYGYLMRKDQHHTIHEMGYTYLAEVLQAVVKKAGSDFNKWFVLNGEERINNRTCYKITINFPGFGYTTYEVKRGENLIKIARKLAVAEYMILENNPRLKDYYDVKEGDKIQVPTGYAKTTIIYVDKLYFLPISTKIYDDKGLFEEYDYFSLQVNPVIADEEFTKNYKEYNF